MPVVWFRPRCLRRTRSQNGRTNRPVGIVLAAFDVDVWSLFHRLPELRIRSNVVRIGQVKDHRTVEQVTA